MSSKKKYLLISFILFIIFLAPLVYITRYAVLLTDDYCLASTSFTDYFNGIKTWYLYQNGRYINSLLGLIPVYKTEIYRLILAFLILLFFYSIYHLINSLSSYYKINFDRGRTGLLSVISSIAIISLLPDLNEFFYWYAASSVYEVSAISFIFFCVLLLKFWLKNELNFYPLIIIVILINGNSEILIGITNFLLLSTLFLEYLKYKSLNYKLILLNIISWISTLMLVLAPGMTARRSQFSYGGDLFGSIKVAVIYGAKFMVVSMFDLPLSIFYIFLFLLLWRYAGKRSPETPVIKPIYLFTISYISIISMVFILYYAMGTFNSNGGWRASNLMRFITFVFYIINLFNLASYLKNRNLNLGLPNYMYLILLIGMVVSLYWNKNYKTMLSSITSNKYQVFSQRLKEREEKIKNNKDSILVLNTIPDAGFLKSGDKEIKNQEWVKHCYLRNLNSKYHKKFIDVIFED